MKENIQIQREAFDKYVADIRDPRYQKIRKILASRKSGELLEVGCCGGEFLQLAQKTGWKVSGLEISKQATKRARDKGLDVKVHDANNKFPFKDNSFDVIIAGEIIEHTFDDVSFLDECYRILKKSGLLIVTTPNLISLKNRLLMLFGFNPRYIISEYHYRTYTQKVFEERIIKSKFQKFKFSGNFVIYSKNRDKILGTLFEKWAEIKPSLAEHLIVSLEK